ncbi:MAG TPA: hypothetical protein VGF01_22645 [Terracidiphilus sp.]
METSDRQIRYCGETRALLSARKVLLRNPLSSRTTIIERGIATALSACTTFASAEEQSLRLAAALGIDQSAGTQVLKSVMDAGLFISIPESKKLFFRFASSATPRRIECIAIPTRNRPEMLRRCLGELQENLAEFGRNPQVVVLDDSDSEPLQRANAEVMDAHARKWGTKLLHIGEEKRSHITAQLARKTGISSESVTFALKRNPEYSVSMGAAQNVLLLATIGRCTLFLDDDVRCRLASIPGSCDDVALRESDIESWFFKDASEIEQCSFVREDLLGLHERLMNLSPSDKTKDFVAAHETDSNTVFRRIESGEARVAAAQMGIVGDSGVDSPLTSYISGRETWTRLSGSEGLYQAAIRNRLIMRGAKNFIVTHNNHTQTHCLALDNRDGLPPFLPIQRGQDGLFGLLIFKCVPNSLFGLIPRAILHSPEQAREFAPGAAVASIEHFLLSEAMMALVSTCGAITGTTTGQRVASLGRSLAELRCASEEEIQDRLHSAIERLMLQLLQVVQARLDQANDAYWRTDLEQIRDAALARLNSRNDLPISDLGNAPGKPYSGNGLREIVLAFAELLQYWPTLVEASSSLQFGLE